VRVPILFNLNKVPRLDAPPYSVVPYNPPFLSDISPPTGVLPSGPAKLYRMVSLSFTSSLKITPFPFRPPASVVPYKLPAASRRRLAVGVLCSDSGCFRRKRLKSNHADRLSWRPKQPWEVLLHPHCTQISRQFLVDSLPPPSSIRGPSARGSGKVLFPYETHRRRLEWFKHVDRNLALRDPVDVRCLRRAARG
jgi:hypothetical protein